MLIMSCGRTRLSADVLIELAKFYNVDMNYICGVTKTVIPFPFE